MFNAEGKRSTEMLPQPLLPIPPVVGPFPAVSLSLSLSLVLVLVHHHFLILSLVTPLLLTPKIAVNDS